MEAKDTVMSGDRIRDVQNDYCLCEFCKVAQAQAEISFKAGYDKALAQLAGMTEECKQMGRREVVEWIRDNMALPKTPLDTTYPDLSFAFGEWQAKLKSWRIE